MNQMSGKENTPFSNVQTGGSVCGSFGCSVGNGADLHLERKLHTCPGPLERLRLSS
jgi:hypothetical protein